MTVTTDRTARIRSSRLFKPLTVYGVEERPEGTLLYELGPVASARPAGRGAPVDWRPGLERLAGHCPDPLAADRPAGER